MKTKKSTRLNKFLSSIIAAFMFFQILLINGLPARKVMADTGFRHEKVNDDVVLGGNYIEVGVSKAGSFGTASAAPKGFHPTCSGIGLSVDGDGFDIGNKPTTGDFFLPGTPEESFTVGYKSGSASAIPTNYTNAERVSRVDIPTVTDDTSSGDTLSSLTSGITKDSNLEIKQKISFKVNDKFFKNSITYTNKGTSTLYDMRYMRSFDPDQDAVLHSAFETYNCVLENFPQDSRAIVRAKGKVTKEPIFFISTDERARASTFGFDNRDPYSSMAYDVDGSKLKKPEALRDEAIAITFALGNLAPGESTTFNYFTSLDPNYEEGLAAIMGYLGLKINDGSTATSSNDVTLNLSSEDAVQMRFSNDNLSWSDWEAFAPTKAWKLPGGDGVKTVYVQYKEKNGKVSSINVSVTCDSGVPSITDVSGNNTSWTNEDVTLTVAANDSVSGLSTKGAYSFNNGPWTTNNSMNFSENGTVNIRVRDNAGNISSKDVVINKIDKKAPVIKSVKSSCETWTSSNVTLTVDAEDENSGLADKPYSFDGGKSWQAENSKVFSEYSSNVIIEVKDAAENITAYAPLNFTNIDRTKPNISGATEGISYFIGRIINISDDIGEISSAVYNKDKGAENSFSNGKLFNEPGNYSLTVEDKAGNSSKLNFEIKSLPKVEDIIYTSESKALIDSIRAEFNSHKDLPEPYKTDTDKEIKALEDRYSLLDKEVKDSKSETDSIKVKVDALSNKVDGLINMKKVIQDEYDKIAGNTSSLTKEQKAELQNEIEYLKGQLEVIKTLQDEIDSIVSSTSSIDTNPDGLISKEDAIKAALSDITKLTKEQQDILQPQTDFLNSLLLKIKTLKVEVQTVKDMIGSLPSPENISKQDMNLMKNVNDAYNKLTNEQKNLVGDVFTNYLKNCLDALSKLTLHENQSDVTVTGIDGTKFDPDVYLVVTPLNLDSTKSEFAASAASVKKAAESIFEIKGKELAVLYDVSLFKDKVKIQPNGKVIVKIKVPENLIGHSGLDIVHIADDGTVTPMHATIVDGYLVFTTTHFSSYGIVQNQVAKVNKVLPKTGYAVDFSLLLESGVLLILAGIFTIKKRQRKALKK